MESILFILALALGGLATWQVFAWRYGVGKRRKAELLKSESTVLLERIEKVFKVVLAEGYFSEIYDHNSRKLFWGVFEANKKVLIVAKAKVAVGYDFSKLKWSRDPSSRKIYIDHFPEPEILSVDPEYRFYDINQGLLHKFNTEDYTRILNEARDLMKVKAMESDLSGIALKQITLMMQQLAASMNWELTEKEEPKSQKTLKESLKGFLK